MLRPLIAVCFILCCSPALAQPAHYQAHVLPGLGGMTARGLAVNNVGVVAGQATRTGQTYEVAAAWVDSVAYDLTGSGISLAGAQGVTDSGLVVGYTDQFGSRAFEAAPPSVPVSMIQPLQNTLGHAYAVNAGGEIVGSYTNISKPFVLRNGVVTQLPLLAGIQGVAYAINNTGMIVGWSDRTSSGGISGVSWVNDSPQELVGGASITMAYGVNDEGWIVGYSSGAPLTTYEASLWTSPTQRLNLGSVNGDWNNIAYGINNHRQIVGTSGGRGFLWQDGQIHDLNALATFSESGYTITDARAISDSGLIAGQATRAGVSYALLLVPSCAADFNHDGDLGTDADIESFFACLGGSCCASCGSADFNGDGSIGTDADIESFFRVLGGGPC